ncbi:fimbrillin family protein [Bacteroides caecigallinarum]|uniref:fimbrillin family protein n=1 Tax=Bacteroides caecigallinarum TaxID=1411144 RepID=UPI00195B5A29|nr:fimbrillin family protein [Bacteroides caecigallinarum]MBM6961999.1 fimbrillin family protein [Bacteroides caecigallinarum]
MKLYNLCLELTALCIVSCTTENNLDTSRDGNMMFSACIGEFASRVMNNGWEGDETIAVCIGETVKSYSITNTGTMNTEEEGFVWADDATSVNVKAWTPYTETSIDLTQQTTVENSSDCDLLACETTATSANVQLAFDHKMTKMQYMLQTYTGYTDEEAKNAKISFFGYASVTFTNGIVTPVGNPDNLIPTYKTRDFNGEALLAPCDMWERPLIQVEIGGDIYVYTPSNSVASDVEKNTGVLVPGIRQQYFLQVSKKGLQVTMESDPVNWGGNQEITDVADSKFKAVVPNEIFRLEGYSVTGIEADGFISDATTGFSITYTKGTVSDGIDFEGMCDRKRTVGPNANTVTFSFTNIRSDIKLVYMRKYMEVGYYFYSDGTYGDTYKDNQTVGIIYKIGQHSTDNVNNYQGTDITEIHGYVVALDDEKNSSSTSAFKWKEGKGGLYSDEYPEIGMGGGNTSKYIGYQNTKYLIDKAKTQTETTVPAASTSTEKNSQSVIKGTSGWYLPSHTQLKDLESLADFSGDGYTALDGTYWDSSFDSDANAYIVVFGSGAISSTDFYRPVDSEQKVRLILTF